MTIVLRAAGEGDFDFCAGLYFAGMEKAIRDWGLDRAKHLAGCRERWKVEQVRLIARGGLDAGWIQAALEGDSYVPARPLVDAPWQGKGIGTEVMPRLIAKAAAAGRPMTLDVVKTNPAQRLYRRLGFEITHDDDRKFCMKWSMAA